MSQQEKPAVYVFDFEEDKIFFGKDEYIAFCCDNNIDPDDNETAELVSFSAYKQLQSELTAEREASKRLVETLSIYAAIGDDDNLYLEEKLEDAIRLRPDDNTTINLGGKLIAADAIKALSEYKKAEGAE